MLFNIFFYFFISGVFRTVDDGSDNESSQSYALSDSDNGLNEQRLFPDRKNLLIPAKKSNQLFSADINNNQLFPDAHKEDHDSSAVNQLFPRLNRTVAASKEEDSVVSSLPGGELDDGNQLISGVEDGWRRIRRIRRQEQQQHLTNGGGQVDLSGNMPGARVRKFFP
jgi:hypothetical protein